MPSIQQTLAAVPSLNSPDLPFTYRVEGDTIVGSWDIVHAQYLTLKEAGTIDEAFTITVEFDERKGTFRYQDRTSEAESSLRVEDGTISFGTQKSFFKGKTAGKSVRFEAGGIYNTAKGLSPVLSAEFETKRIKEPLFAFLEQQGWKRKKGFLGLF